MAILGFNNLKESQGDFYATVSWAAFVVTRDTRTAKRDLGAVALVDTLARLVPGNRWGLEASRSVPENVRGDNLFSATVDKAGVAMWAVSWQQSMELGQALTAEELAALDPFDTVDVRYPLTDSAPVAEDIVTLPQDQEE